MAASINWLNRHRLTALLVLAVCIVLASSTIAFLLGSKTQLTRKDDDRSHTIESLEPGHNAENDSVVASETAATIVPTNNQILCNPYPWRTARGELTVINGAATHAVAKLIEIQGDTKILSFVICANHQSTVSVPDGNYRLIFAFGNRLYAGEDCVDRLEAPHGFAKFDRSIIFTTENTTKYRGDVVVEDTQYSVVSITLTPVAGGNVTTSSISRSEFEKY